jgi:predicted ester cyclase
MTTNTARMIERIPLEVLNNGNFGLVDELLSPDFVEHTPRQGVAPTRIAPTRTGFKQSATALKTAFPDLRYTIDDSIESGDQIVHRLTASGTMKGDFMGMPATGKRATWTEIHIGRVANGRLTEHWGLVDQLGMLVQLGVVQAPGRPLVTA